MDTRLITLLPHTQVLFPGATLPLLLWQSKDRKAVRDAIRGDRSIGIVALPEMQKGDYLYVDSSPRREQPVPKVGHVGCIGTVLSAKKLPARQVRIVVQGLSRFAVKAIAESAEPYLVAEVTPYVDFEESPRLLEAFADEVRLHYDRFVRASGKIAGGPAPKPAQLPSDPAELSMLLPDIMRLDEETCQRFLSSRSALMRLRELSAILAPAVTSAESGAEVRARSRSNGHGATKH